MEMELRFYETPAGRRPFIEWFEGLKDIRTRQRIDARLARIAAGNLGDVKSVGDGVLELRIDYGPGYRLYCGRIGRVVLMLLCGGDKSSQTEDIKRAKKYFKDACARSSR